MRSAVFALQALPNPCPSIIAYAVMARPRRQQQLRLQIRQRRNYGRLGKTSNSEWNNRLDLCIINSSSAVKKFTHQASESYFASSRPSQILVSTSGEKYHLSSKTILVNSHFHPNHHHLHQPTHPLILTMASNNNATSYGTIQSNKNTLPLYNTTSRTSTGSASTTDALLKKDAKKDAKKEPAKVSAKSLYDCRYILLI